VIIPEEPRPVPRRFTIVQAAHQIGPIEMAPGNTVACGTPIRPGKGGWVVAKDGRDIWAYVGTVPNGVQPTVEAWREITAEVGATTFPAGARLKVAFVNDDGMASIVPDVNGHVATIGRTRIVFLPTGPTPYIPPPPIPATEPPPIDAVIGAGS
jgi:hypothetical protein